MGRDGRGVVCFLLFSLSATACLFDRQFSSEKILNTYIHTLFLPILLKNFIFLFYFRIPSFNDEQRKPESDDNDSDDGNNASGGNSNSDNNNNSSFKSENNSNSNNTETKDDAQASSKKESDSSKFHDDDDDDDDDNNDNSKQREDLELMAEWETLSQEDRAVRR